MSAGTQTEEQEILEIYLVVNGALGMSPGKIASQAFQAGQRLFAHAAAPDAESELRQLLDRWKRQGTRTICRVAETQHVFDRVCAEVPGATMVDDGMTEVAPDTATVHATWPIWRHQAPTAIKHKRCRMLNGAAVTA
jgi:peptidyl-tRNA hydrolase